MQFTSTLTVNPADHPDQVGELLRDAFFNQKKGYGGYSTFELQDDVKVLSETPVDCKWDSDNEGLTRKHSCKTIDGQVVKMSWYWDGDVYVDGDLRFVFEDGSTLINDDCKGPHGWRFAKA